MSKAKKATVVEPIVPPRQPTEAEYFEQVVDMMRVHLATAQARLATFRDDLDKNQKNPAHVLSWSNSTFEAAGMVAAHGSMLTAIDKPGSKVTLRWMRHFALREAVNYARNGSSSTSPIDNHMAKCIAAGWAHLFEMVDGLVEK